MAGCVALCVAVAEGQIAASSAAQTAYSQGRPAVESGTAAHGFEVATVRLANRNDGRQWFGTQGGAFGQVLGVGDVAEEPGVVRICGYAEDGTVEGGPKWAETDQWDIEAKMDEADMGGWEKLSDRERMERVRPLLRALLEDRFKLKVHTEMKVTPVYALVAGEGRCEDEGSAAAAGERRSAGRGRAERSKNPGPPRAGSWCRTKAGWGMRCRCAG